MTLEEKVKEMEEYIQKNDCDFSLSYHFTRESKIFRIDIFDCNYELAFVLFPDNDFCSCVPCVDVERDDYKEIPYKDLKLFVKIFELFGE